MIKKLHMTWAQGASLLPPEYQANLDRWRVALPTDWEIKVWDIPAASTVWPDFASVEAKCVHHATRSDIIQTRVMRDIGGIYVGTDSTPAGGFPDFLRLIEHADSHVVLDAPNRALMNCLSYSDGKNVDFWACAVKHQLRHGGAKLRDPNVHWATGPGCLWEAFSAHQWPLVMSTIGRAYTHHWKKPGELNDSAFVNPGYASSWHRPRNGVDSRATVRP